MNQFLQNMMGMGGITDQVIATDLLISVKSGVHNYAVAITEAATPELRAALKEQLFAAIDTHEAVSNYMVAKGFYHPHNLGEQLNVDLTVTDTALNLAER
jgi:similar to spore coat protein